MEKEAAPAAAIEGQAFVILACGLWVVGWLDGWGGCVT